jgi:protein-L-isoaspartate(D-aspartate) O-methyltransferase
MVTSLSKAHSNMVVQQVRPGEVLDKAVLLAMSEVPRARFVDAELIELAYADTQLPIGCGQVMLTPTQEGRFLQALQLKADEEVLEIGTGSGYFTALLAKLAGKVISVELYEELSAKAAERLQALGIENVELHIGDAAKGWPTTERVDAIVVTAAFVTVPDEFLYSLKVGGRLLVVTGKAPAMSVQLIRRTSEWDWQPEFLFETVIPVMVNAEPKPEFEF